MKIGFSTANTFIFGIENLLVFWLAAKMIMTAQIAGGIGMGGGAPFTIGMMFAFISCKGQYTGRITALINYAVQIRMLSLHAERLADICLATPERDTPQGNLQMRLTRLVIAHRPETIAGAQRVVQVKDGAVVELMRAVGTVAPAGEPGLPPGALAST